MGEGGLVTSSGFDCQISTNERPEPITCFFTIDRHAFRGRNDYWCNKMVTHPHTDLGNTRVASIIKLRVPRSYMEHTKYIYLL